ncbi:ParB/RepB/Spo0J family partition protein [Nitrospina watsonii]|uniref:Chromosome (Plasmid) partitioning protein ParB / Stage 0 sporulation protein J n=1 Tax=Nitrospina watsonii TaxID=1323948 RepID=A0ABM9HHI0_9BACT|nr:ParB/RepB/Spo0J family partition protein [Nitrospina watsonii]CAI2719722.1 Chromosome (plasmid) partitioning protein ParB / Stage 0 sporulation protein J [Nitrospina watsonii]
MTRKALGKGIDALFGDAPKETEAADKAASGSDITVLPLEQIVPNTHQPRKEFDDEKLAELVESIQQNGVIQPIVVQRQGEGYQLICGERRWRASQKAGKKDIPVVIRDVTDTESLQLALIENIHRQDLNPIEEAEAYQRLVQDHGLTQDEVAQQVGKNRATVANTLRLLKLSKAIKDDLASGRLSMGHARALLAIGNERDREDARQQAVRKGLNVRQLEQMAQRQSQPAASRPAKKSAQKDVFINDLEKQFQRALGTKVSVNAGKKGGQVVIQYYDNDDLQRIHDMIIK